MPNGWQLYFYSRDRVVWRRPGRADRPLSLEKSREAWDVRAGYQPEMKMAEALRAVTPGMGPLDQFAALASSPALSPELVFGNLHNEGRRAMGELPARGCGLPDNDE